MHLGFLNTADIRLFGSEKIHKTFIDTGAQTVDIPGNKFHTLRLRGLCL
jgi:hypothetical protein